MTSPSTRFAVARWIVGSTFVLAGIAKWVWPPAAPSVYATFVALWPPLGPVWAGLEVALGLLLIAGAFPSLVRPAALLVLSAFVGILALELLSPTPRVCGCLGTLVLPTLGPRVQLGLSLTLDLVLIGLLLLPAPATSRVRPALGPNLSHAA